MCAVVVPSWMWVYKSIPATIGRIPYSIVGIFLYTRSSVLWLIPTISRVYFYIPANKVCVWDCHVGRCPPRNDGRYSTTTSFRGSKATVGIYWPRAMRGMRYSRSSWHPIPYVATPLTPSWARVEVCCSFVRLSYEKERTNTLPSSAYLASKGYQ